MKSLFFLFFFVIFLIPLAAGALSPTNLVYSIIPEEESCQIIQVTQNSGTLTVFDKWAENPDVEWRVSLFNTDAEEHNLTLTYPQEVSGEEDVEVCTSGTDLGDYHGAIIFRQEQEGNSIIQYAVWLKVIISEPEKVQETSVDSGQNAGGSSGSGSSNSNPSEKTREEVVKIEEEIIEPKQEIIENEVTEEENSDINKEKEPKKNPIALGMGVGLIIIIAIISFFVVKRRKKHAP